MNKILSIVLLLLISIPACCTLNPCNDIDATSQVENTVLLFAENYGTGRMDEAAAITTMKFRDGVPGSMWVADVYPKSEHWEYKKITTEILTTKIEGDKAVVFAEAKISTAVGEALQKEVYYLIRFREKWLIDELEVLEEDVEFIDGEV